jgi:hypothetical protein
MVSSEKTRLIRGADSCVEAAPVSERADLAGSLIESLDETHDPFVEAAATKKPSAAWPTWTPRKSNPFPRKKATVTSPSPLNEYLTARPHTVISGEASLCLFFPVRFLRTCRPAQREISLVFSM